MQFQLAGFADVREGAVADGPAGAPTLRAYARAGARHRGRELNPDTPTQDQAREGQPAGAGKVSTAAKKGATAVKAAAATSPGRPSQG